jgi:phosphatidylglycerophosphatase A
VLIIFLSIYVSNLATKDLVNKDHKSIVIDEMAGIWLAMIPVIYIASSQYERTLYAVLTLIFFRLFDILKPYPISYVDKNFKGGFGIVLDDLIAGVFAGILATVLTLYLI